jgi:hypothetical protein
VGCQSAGPLLTTEKTAGPWGLAGWAAKAGSSRSKKEELGEEKETLQIFKGIQANEFKHRFEFNQSKIELQHECNNKLLWFIYLIKKNN